jgi:hypothetical protein
MRLWLCDVVHCPGFRPRAPTQGRRIEPCPRPKRTRRPRAAVRRLWPDLRGRGAGPCLDPRSSANGGLDQLSSSWPTWTRLSAPTVNCTRSAEELAKLENEQRSGNDLEVGHHPHRVVHSWRFAGISGERYRRVTTMTSQGEANTTDSDELDRRPADPAHPSMAASITFMMRRGPPGSRLEGGLKYP